MATYYVDESGFTGEDLLAPDQPLFAQATNNFTSDEAKAIIGATFCGVDATELKHSRLKRNRRHRERIIELVRIVAYDPTRAGTWIAHKEFALVTLVVDWWMEPLAHRSGLNLYKDGANLGMANMLFVCLEGFWSKTFRRKLLLHF